MAWGFKSEGNRTVIRQDGVARVAINEDGSMELLTPAANPTGNDVPTAGQLGFGKMYESPQQSWSAGSLITLPHGLPAAPKLRQLSAVCVTAEQGFVAGEELTIGTSDFVGPAQNAGYSMRADTASVKVKIGASGLQAIRDSDGLIILITPANWRLIVRAWA